MSQKRYAWILITALLLQEPENQHPTGPLVCTMSAK